MPTPWRVATLLHPPSSPQTPGTIYRVGLADLGSAVHPYASHALDLRTTIELGRGFGYRMPDSVLIYAVEIKENILFTESLSPEVEKAVTAVAREIMETAGLLFEKANA